VVSAAADRSIRPDRATSGWTVITLLLAVILIGPIVAVFVAATGDTGGLWRHLFSTVLPRYVANTLVLMAGVGALTLVIGVSTAWIVTRWDFPGRRVVEWSLLLPAAVPAYIVAYTYTDFLEFAGPLQTALREAFGWQTKRDYWFPEIRSMPGAIAVLALALYPYVYMMTRMAFQRMPGSFFEVARIHKRNYFRDVALPLARPAITAGVALALMETVSDFGTVEYFALETLTLGIFNVWLGMNSLPGAAQIACVAFLFVIALLAVETYARGKRGFADTSRRHTTVSPVRTTGLHAAACLAACATPVILGFLIPAGILLSFVLQDYSVGDYARIAQVAINSVLVALSVAAMVMAGAAVMVIESTFYGTRLARTATALASTGYAFPGTILAIGVVTFAGFVDDGLQAVAEGLFHIPYGGLTGTIGLVLIACMVRFQAIGYGAMMSGANRMPPNVVSASRVLGMGFGGTMRRVVLPLLRGSLFGGGLLVFVDVMKELPMTLLLRPFNFDTLATYVYQFAKDELLEKAALPALVIVLAGIGPVILMNAVLARAARGGTDPDPGYRG
jgi:iron(III) transport system permease protein